MPGLRLAATTLARGALAMVASLLLWSVVPVLLGWQPTVVLTGSMQPQIRPGDVVVSRPVAVGDAAPGRVLLVRDPDRPGRLRLHRLVEYDNGQLILRGDANPTVDASPVEPQAVRGVGVLRIPLVGLPALWLREHEILPLVALVGIATILGWLADPPRIHRRSVRRQRVLAALAVAAPIGALLLLQLSPATLATFSAQTASTANHLAAANSFVRYDSAVLADGPHFYWRLADGTTGIAADSTGRGRTGAYYGGVSSVPAGPLRSEPDAAIQLSASGYVARTATSSFGAQSVELWFATTSTTGGPLMGLGDRASGRSTQVRRSLYLGDDGRLHFGVSDTFGFKVTVSSPTSYANGQWHHVVATFSALGTLTLFVDGQQVANGQGFLNLTTASGYWRTGYDNLTGWPARPSSDGVVAAIDEVAVYDHVLSPERVRTHWDAH